MKRITQTISTVEKITSIFTHIKNLLVIVCIIAMLIVAWKAWQWMDVTSKQIPNTQAVMTRVSEVKERLGEVELPTLPDTGVIGDKYAEVKDKAGRIITYRPDWLSSGGTQKEGAEQENEVALPESVMTEENTGITVTTEEPLSEPAASQIKLSAEMETLSAERQERERTPYSSRLGRLGERVGGVIDQVDQNVQGVQEKIDPLLERVEGLSFRWSRRNDAATNADPVTLSRKDVEAEIQGGDTSDTKMP